jgi:hypothetical protein
MTPTRALIGGVVVVFPVVVVSGKVPIVLDGEGIVVVAAIVFIVIVNRGVVVLLLRVRCGNTVYGVVDLKLATTPQPAVRRTRRPLAPLAPVLPLSTALLRSCSSERAR